MEYSIEHFKPKVLIVGYNDNVLVCSIHMFTLQFVCPSIALQVSNALSDLNNEYRGWWLEALDHAEKDKDLSNELIRKMEEAISGSLKSRRTSRMSSWSEMI